MPTCGCGRLTKRNSNSCEQCVALHTLELERGASSKEIEDAYRMLVKVWHPDRFQHDGKMRDKTGKKLADINAAYQYLLKDPPSLTSSNNKQSSGKQGDESARASHSYETPKSSSNTVPNSQHTEKQGQTVTTDRLMVIGRFIFGGSIALILASVIVGTLHSGTANQDRLPSDVTESSHQPAPANITENIPQPSSAPVNQSVVAESGTDASVSPLSNESPSQEDATTKFPAIVVPEAEDNDEKLQGHIAPIVRIDPINRSVTYPDRTSRQASHSADNATNVSGNYLGSVFNGTVRTQARTLISLRQNGSELSGCFVVSPPLYGSGPLAGTVSGNVVQFKTSGSGMVISFTGSIDTNRMTGSYVVQQADSFQQAGNLAASKDVNDTRLQNAGPVSCPVDNSEAVADGSLTHQ